MSIFDGRTPPLVARMSGSSSCIMAGRTVSYVAREDVSDMGDLVPGSAIIFDLFGTLVDNFSFQRHEQVVTRMASLLGFHRANFAHWYGEGTGEGRLGGQFPTVEANLAHICSQLAVEPHPDRVAAAADVTINFTRELLTPRDGAVEMLAELKRLGYRLGLISDCSPAVPRLWPDTPFAPLIDAPIFSCLACLRKPDPRIYALACARLGTRAEHCVYVGDGSSDELRGATEAGMRAVLFCCDYTDSYDAHRPGVAGWQGPAISCFEDLLSQAFIVHHTL